MLEGLRMALDITNQRLSRSEDIKWLMSPLSRWAIVLLSYTDRVT